MGNTGKTVGTVGGAAAGSFFGPVGTMVGGALGGMVGGLFDGDDTEKAEAAALNPRAFQRNDSNVTSRAFSSEGGRLETQGNTALHAGQIQADNQRTDARLARSSASGTASTQQQIGDIAAQAQSGQAAKLRGNATTAQNRLAPQINTAGADQAQAQQYAALGGVAQQAQQGANTGAIKDFYQQGPGPSAAQAQLAQGQDASMGQALALARSGRAGTNPAAERQAMFQNAATNQNTNQQSAQLRAQEEQGWRGQQLTAMGQEQQAEQAARGAQLQALGLQQSGLQNLGSQDLAEQQLRAQNELASRGQNDQSALGYQNAANQAQALGYNTQLGAGALANQTLGNANQYQVAMNNAATGQQQAGQQFYLGANNLSQDYERMGQASLEADRAANAAFETTRSGYQQQTNLANAGYENAASQANNAANTGMLMGVANAAYRQSGGGGDDPYGIGSDRDAKEAIKPRKGIAAELARLSERAQVEDRPAATAGAPRGDVDTRGLDEASARQAAALGADMRGAEGYSYNYKDPSRFGGGRHVGPMAQDLEKSDATRGAVFERDGVKRVDPGRLTMVNTSAIGEQQRRMDDLDRQVEALSAERGKAAGESAYEGSQYAGDRYGLNFKRPPVKDPMLAGLGYY